MLADAFALRVAYINIWQPTQNPRGRPLRRRQQLPGFRCAFPNFGGGIPDGNKAECPPLKGKISKRRAHQMNQRQLSGSVQSLENGSIVGEVEHLPINLETARKALLSKRREYFSLTAFKLCRNSPIGEIASGAE